MKQKRVLKGLIFVCILCASFLCSLFINLNLKNENHNVVSGAYLHANNVEAEILSLQTPENILVENLEPNYDGFNSVSYSAYNKGDKKVNIMFNFVNYPGDTTNYFTSEEISSIVSTCEEDVNTYFERMSQGYVALDIDYVVTTAPYSYNEYLNQKKAVFGTELSIFSSGVTGLKDEKGNTKTFSFDKYNMRVNFFAGHAGGWSTFLWPHAWMGNNLILMTESRGGYSAEQCLEINSTTLCHELMHTFGVGDLYAYVTSGNQNFGAQYLDMMGSSSKNLSTNAYYRQKAGWLTESSYADNETSDIEELPTNSKSSLTLQLYPNCSNNNKTIAYKFGENTAKNEFFVVEYRIKDYEYGTAKFDSAIYKTSVVIYRVNSSADGNSNGHNGGINEVIFMGDSSYDVTTKEYSDSCSLDVNDTYGNRGETTTTSLVYSSAGGKDNLFNGGNSGISVYVNSLTNEYATITITFKEDLDVIDLSNTKWKYDSQNPFTYNGTEFKVSLENVPAGLTCSYEGDLSATNAGTYQVKVVLIYDEKNYELRNLNFALSITWVIKPADVTVSAHNKTSKYGESFKDLTCAVTNGQLYASDKLDVSLTKEAGSKVGTYKIKCEVEKNSNYNITEIDGEYVITSRVIHIQVLNQSFYEDKFQYLNNEKYLILSSGDTVLQKDGNVVYLYVPGLKEIKVGEYEIYAMPTNSNYQLVVTTGMLQILEEIEEPIIPEDSISNNSSSTSGNASSTDINEQFYNNEQISEQELKRNKTIIISVSIGVILLVIVVGVISCVSMVKKHKQQQRWDTNFFDNIK